jgi:hypothetical protein
MELRSNTICGWLVWSGPFVARSAANCGRFHHRRSYGSW